jgi:hypothetical protein
VISGFVTLGVFVSMVAGCASPTLPARSPPRKHP